MLAFPLNLYVLVDLTSLVCVCILSVKHATVFKFNGPNLLPFLYLARVSSLDDQWLCLSV